MAHLTDEDLLARLDGETDGARRDSAAAHLAGCAVCRGRMRQLRATLHAYSALLAQVDAAEPAEWHAGSAAQEAEPSKVRGSRRTGRERAATTAAWRWAAMLTLLLFGAGVSATVLTGNRAAMKGQQSEAPRETQPGLDAYAGAVIVSPSDNTVRITIHGAGPAPAIDAALHSRQDVLVAVTGAAIPRFAAREGAVTVTVEDPRVRVQVRFPADLRAGSINADGVEVARISHGALVTPD